MQFDVRVCPPFDHVSELEVDDEHEFISLDIPGATARWTYDGARFEVVFDHYGGGTREPLNPVERDSEAGVVVGKREQPVSCGALIFQERAPNTIHIEYLPEKSYGRDVDTATPERDLETEDMLHLWLQANEAGAVTAVQEESGELR